MWYIVPLWAILKSLKLHIFKILLCSHLLLWYPFIIVSLYIYISFILFVCLYVLYLCECIKIIIYIAYNTCNKYNFFSNASVFRDYKNSPTLSGIAPFLITGMIFYDSVSVSKTNPRWSVIKVKHTWVTVKPIIVHWQFIKNLRKIS